MVSDFPILFYLKKRSVYCTTTTGFDHSTEVRNKTHSTERGLLESRRRPAHSRGRGECPPVGRHRARCRSRGRRGGGRRGRGRGRRRARGQPEPLRPQVRVVRAPRAAPAPAAGPAGAARHLRAAAARAAAAGARAARAAAARGPAGQVRHGAAAAARRRLRAAAAVGRGAGLPLAAAPAPPAARARRRRRRGAPPQGARRAPAAPAPAPAPAAPAAPALPARPARPLRRHRAVGRLARSFATKNDLIVFFSIGGFFGTFCANFCKTFLCRKRQSGPPTPAFLTIVNWRRSFLKLYPFPLCPMELEIFNRVERLKCKSDISSKRTRPRTTVSVLIMKSIKRLCDQTFKRPIVCRANRGPYLYVVAFRLSCTPYR